MPIIYLKSGGYCECEGYTIKDNCIKAVGVKFNVENLPEELRKQQEAVIPLNNVLYILPQK
ncbi:MAG: hypothetical protein N2323_04360 [candidate division WOR-3 bacterium]|nr:hypothetical protein [candidate division WOR-3 bacterium]MCX7837174.1 hypothetical protein [candidate division WOR-3 bacterium]MDW8114454.1 hypothetical protein [candidate division WOR-3 bacterium]